MQIDKTIFVTGATGNQGGAVARNLVGKGFKVKALTRDPGSPKAEKLRKLNIELVKGDLNDSSSFRSHLKDVDGIFSVQAFADNIEKEIQQGKKLANLAVDHRVKHFVYSSVAGADLKTNVPHWDSKFEIESHIKRLDLPYTILRPASFYENFLVPQVKTRLLKGKLVSPVNAHIIQQYIAADDIGKICTQIFISPQTYNLQTMTLVSEQMKQDEVAKIFSRALGKEIKYQKLPALITRLFMGKHLYTMFKWINDNGGDILKDITGIRNEFPGMMKLEQWIATNFGIT